MVSPDSVYT